MVREIIFFAGGNSNDPRVWSNVPCLYSRTLEKKGYVVHRVNIRPNDWIVERYNNQTSRLRRLFHWDMTRPFSHSLVGYFYGRMVIRRALRKYKNANLCIFMGTGQTNFGENRPSVIFCEDAYENRIKATCNRKPHFWEQLWINREIAAWNKSDLVTILFPQDMPTIERTAPHANVKYRNGNVINSFYNGELDEEEILRQKRKSNKILFVGGKHYKEGADMTVSAFRLLKKRHPELELHIIGITSDQFEDLPEDVHCHGYLNKDNPASNKDYYELFKTAKVYINATPRWGGYSSCVESMYFYCPVVVHPYGHFVSEFGENIDFGTYNSDFTPEGVAASLEQVITSPTYESYCRNAHERVKEYTWDKYIDWTFEELAKVRPEIGG